MKTLKPLKLNRKLRRWQELAVRRFFALDKEDFLLVATPGGGKTLTALLIAYELLYENKVERLVIVTPTEHLKRQWAEAAANLGIDLDYAWANSSGRESADYFGVAVTYQQISFAPDLYDLNCTRRKTLVIFDEIHHAGDNLDWGAKLRHAFRSAAYRLLLSGTPFRSDNNPIPFVEYEDNRSLSDFTYGYGDALAGDVCRPIYFPTVEGNVAWIRPNGQEMACSLLDELPRTKANERLRTALDAGGEWLSEVLAEADALLTKMRFEGHRDAAGLVIASDQYHARRIAGLLKVITNETPTIAISDEEQSTHEIRKFGKRGNAKRWIVAVRMVSEGVDLPRLRVGVYATTILSEMFFRQVVGRFVRMIEGLEEQSAALFLPSDERLVRHALAIRDEREHVLTEKIETGEGYNRESENRTGGNLMENGNGDDFDEQSLPDENGDEILSTETFSGNTDSLPGLDDSLSTDRGGNLAGGENRKFIIPLSSTAQMHETVFNGDRYSPVELQRAEIYSNRLGIKAPPAQVAALIKLVTSQLAPASPTLPNLQLCENTRSENTGGFFAAPNSPAPAASLLAERKHQLRREINMLANRLAYQSNMKPDEIHRRWIAEENGSKNSLATETELQKKYDWLKAEIIKVQQNRQLIKK